VFIHIVTTQLLIEANLLFMEKNLCQRTLLMM